MASTITQMQDGLGVTAYTGGDIPVLKQVIRFICAVNLILQGKQYLLRTHLQ